jgi:hypothetical protein
MQTRDVRARTPRPLRGAQRCGATVFQDEKAIANWCAFIAWEDDPGADPTAFVETRDGPWIRGGAAAQPDEGRLSLDAIRGVVRSELAAVAFAVPSPAPELDRESNAFDADAACDEVLASLGYKIAG